MIIETESLGNVEYDENSVIKFEDGLYGFGGMKNFVLIMYPFEGLPFHYLQSVDDTRLSFVVTSPFLFVENYEFDIPDDTLEKIGVTKTEDMDIYSITVIPDEIKETTINLKAPLVINRTNNNAMQYIIDDEYPYKYRIFDKEDDEIEGGEE